MPEPELKMWEFLEKEANDDYGKSIEEYEPHEKPSDAWRRMSVEDMRSIIADLKKYEEIKAIVGKE